MNAAERRTPTLELLIGMIASGKSTYARKRADEGALVVSHDALTEMLHARYRYEQGLRECYRSVEESVAWAAFAAGRDVVVDRTHLTAESRARWVRWAANTYDALNAYDGHGPQTAVIAVPFGAEPPEAHALRRFESDPRGRSYEDWLAVARHHAGQAEAEPLDWVAEGFAAVIPGPCPTASTSAAPVAARSACPSSTS